MQISTRLEQRTMNEVSTSISCNTDIAVGTEQLGMRLETSNGQASGDDNCM